MGRGRKHKGKTGRGGQTDTEKSVRGRQMDTGHSGKSAQGGRQTKEEQRATDRGKMEKKRERESSSDSQKDAAVDNLLDSFLQELKQNGAEVLSEEIKEFVKRRKLSPELQKTKQLFSTTPCLMTEEKFFLINGLILNSNETPTYDKFHANTISSEALRAVYCLIGVAMGCPERALNYAVGEAKREGLSQVLLCAFRRFTTPRGHKSLQEGKDEDNKDNKKDEDEDSEDNNWGKDLHVDLCEERELYEEEEEQGDSESGSDILGSERSLKLEPQMQDPSAHRQHADLVAKVYRETPHGTTEETRIVVDLKTLASYTNLFQAAQYAIGIAKKASTAKKVSTHEHIPPICLQVWDKTTWYYAYIEVHGIVTVLNGKITEASLAAFPAKQRGKLIKQFKEWGKTMEKEEMIIPDGSHAVGRLYLNTKMFYMPHFSEDAVLTGHTKLFLGGILRTLVGPKVESWRAEDVYRAFFRRAEVLELITQMKVPRNEWHNLPGLIGELLQVMSNLETPDELKKEYSGVLEFIGKLCLSRCI